MSALDDVDEEPRPPVETYEEITLADIVRVLHRRKLVLFAVFAAVVLGATAITVLATPQYESTTTLIPLEHEDILKNWLSSRHAAELVVDEMEDRLGAALMSGRWDEATQAWRGAAPTREELGRQLQERVDVRASTTRAGQQVERLIEVRVELPNPLLSRDVANAFVRTLDELRPVLEGITRQEAFDRYYDGQNEQDANRQAEVAARQKAYWLVLDSANLPDQPSSPNVTLNLALGVVLGLMLGVFAVFFFEWLGRYRAESKAPSVAAQASRVSEARTPSSRPGPSDPPLGRPPPGPPRRRGGL